jgi:hypothetical protein
MSGEKWRSLLRERSERSWATLSEAERSEASEAEP